MTTIKNSLPAPKFCDNCCSTNIQFLSNSIIYGTEHGKWPFCYFCHDCRAAVGCHFGTEIPLGKMADSATRSLRIKAHTSFDQLWREGLMSRSKAYNWLASVLDIPADQCHISWLTKEQLHQVSILSFEYIKQNHAALIKRKIKKEARQNASEFRKEKNNRTKEYIRKRKQRRKSK